MVVNLGNPQIELALSERLNAREVVSVREAKKASTFQVNDDILILTDSQKKGWVAALICPQGSTLCYSGTVDLSAFAQTDVMFCTKKPPTNACARLYVGRYEEGLPPGKSNHFLSARTPTVCLGVGEQLIYYEEN